MATEPALPPSATAPPLSLVRHPKLFPGAAQPDVLRASQKDDLYLHTLSEACLEAVRRLLGPRRALLRIREIHLFCELAYYGLTTGAGTQTLGEEYCDILQVSGRIGVQPGWARRWALVLMHTLVPYALERVAPSARQGERESEEHASSFAPGVPRSLRESHPDPDDAAVRQPLARLRAQLHARAAAAWRQLRSVCHWAAQQTGTAGRLHLGLFYCYGVYHSWAKRLTGVRYLFIGQLFEQRPTYRLLGFLLFLQLGIGAAVAAARQALVGLGLATSAQQPDKDEPLPPEASSEVPPSPESSVAPHQRCPLCLSRRTHPTASPCGHVFCWHCIAEWCQRKPECPLCRAPFSPSHLICLHHTDF